MSGGVECNPQQHNWIIIIIIIIIIICNIKLLMVIGRVRNM
jgi:hypothetical protein